MDQPEVTMQGAIRQAATYPPDTSWKKNPTDT